MTLSPTPKMSEALSLLEQAKKIARARTESLHEASRAGDADFWKWMDAVQRERVLISLTQTLGDLIDEYERS